MKLNRLFSSFLYIASFLILYSLVACSSSSSSGSGGISISSPNEGVQVSGVLMVEGSCSAIDELAVVIDDDSFTKQVVDCVFGNWNAVFDTSYFQDGDHALLAYNGNINDSVQITTANSNQSGFIVTVPVSLATGIYDEIDQLTPLYVYAKKIATGLISGQRFTLGAFPGEFEIPNLLNGVYEIGAFLDRNNNRIMDEGWDYSGTAVALLEVSNNDISSGGVELDVYIIDDGTDYEAGIFNPGDVSGTVSISSPMANETVIGVLEAAGGASGSIENVQVTIDNNLLSAQVVSVGGANWGASFDTTRLQDGLHYLTARANDEIEAVVFFTTDNSNTQGYAVTVSVELTAGISADINSLSPLFVYVETPVSGARQIARFESTDFGADSAFTLTNVPNNTYQVGAFHDDNNNGVADTGEYVGVAEELLNVWYADTSAAVTLHGNEVHIVTPTWGTEIRSNFIEMSGTYTSGAEQIILLMNTTGVGYNVESTANFNAGEWDAILDISEVTQEGTRWLYAEAKYGVVKKTDSIQVVINRDFPRGVAIELPADDSTIQTNTFITSGSYDGVPESVTLYLDRGDAVQVSVVATFNNSAWSASFTDLTGVETGLIPHTLTAVADYGGGITEEAVISIYINPIEYREVFITVPVEGATVTTDNLVVQGTYQGSPESITVTLETNDSAGLLTEVVSTPTGNAWSIEFTDISSVINGQRSITAVADYGGSNTEVDSITVMVDRLVAATPLTISTPIPYLYEGGTTYFNINGSNVLSLETIFGPSTPGVDAALVMSLFSSDTQANFDVGTSWTLYSRSHNNPVDETVIASYILQRNGGGDYFKLTIGFETNSGDQFAINSLTGWNCGAIPGDCP